MSKFKITPYDTKEYHCRQALKSFDPSCIITIDKEDLIVETSKLDYQTIKSFTSVKEVTNIDSQLIMNYTYTYTPSLIIQGSNIFSNCTTLNTNPNGTCLLFSELKNKINTLVSSTVSGITNSSPINLLDNISGISYLVPNANQNSKVIDIINPTTSIYDHCKCQVFFYGLPPWSNNGPWLSFYGSNSPFGANYKNVIDVYESIRGIITIVYV